MKFIKYVYGILGLALAFSAPARAQQFIEQPGQATIPIYSGPYNLGGASARNLFIRTYPGHAYALEFVDQGGGTNPNYALLAVRWSPDPNVVITGNNQLFQTQSPTSSSACTFYSHNFTQRVTGSCLSTFQLGNGLAGDSVFVVLPFSNAAVIEVDLTTFTFTGNYLVYLVDLGPAPLLYVPQIICGQQSANTPCVPVAVDVLGHETPGLVQAGTTKNSEATSGVGAAVTTSIAGVASQRVYLSAVAVRCSAGNASVTIKDGVGGTTIWSSDSSFAGSATRTITWTVPLASSSGNGMDVVLGSCGGGNTGTLDVQASQL
jgi:hypothetical protein